MKPLLKNEAVSAMFRVFGGTGRPLQGDEVKRLASLGTHLWELRVLGTLIPAIFAAAMFERLEAWLGPWWVLLLLLPAVFLGTQVLGAILGLLARTMARAGGDLEIWQWTAWFAALSAWALWAWQLGGWIRWVAGFWFLVAAVEFVSWVFLGWQRLMRVPGRAGILMRIVLAVLVHLPLLPLGFGGHWGWVAGWMAMTGLGWCRATFAANARGFGPVVSRCDGAGVWITIDDGPDPETTPALLDLLDQYDARATFFVVGDRAEAHPELTREIVRRGHRLANHTATHPAASFWCAGPDRTRREIIEASRAIERITGARPRWFRAPVGHSNYFTHPVAMTERMQVVGWSRKGRDGLFRNVPAILARLTHRLQRGDIVVLHDATPVASDVLQGLLETMQKSGLKTAVPEE